jgi:hypothetical protein
MQVERDFPLGHPKAIDTVPGSPEHKAWLDEHDKSGGERDFPVGHPKSADTPGNLNHLAWAPGVDPRNPHLEPFTGYTPEKAAAIRQFNLEAAKKARESKALTPIDANVANAALEQKRKELGVDALTAAQHDEVLAALQTAAQKG